MKLVEPLVSWQPEIAAIRRDIHAHPELAYEEFRTADVVAAQLESWGIPVHRGLGVTGVVGTIEGTAGPGGAIGLRADMDALPMQETNAFEHASKHPGKMHACGHDGHVAMLLAAARYLSQHRNFPGTVYLIFQPAEEGFSGAKRMIDDGLFDLFPADAVFGMHNWPGLPEGSFGITPGPIMGGSNNFEIVLNGKGAHAAMPNLGHDPIMAAVHLVQSLQTTITRNLDPLEPAVLSVTQIHSGTADNVIPDSAEIRGTVRTLSEEALDLIEGRMTDIVEHTARAFNCTSKFVFARKYPPTVNHPNEAALCTEVARDLVGNDLVFENIRPSMGAEDFAFMLKEKPGCYLWIGNGDGDHRTKGHGLGPCTLHNGSYDFNDNLLPVGASFWVNLAWRWLAANAKT